MDVPLNEIAIKVHKYTKYEIKVQNFFRFLVSSQYFKFSFHYMCWQNEVTVVKSHHGISAKWSQYQYTRPTDPSLVTKILQYFKLMKIPLILSNNQEVGGVKILWVGKWG